MGSSHSFPRPFCSSAIRLYLLIYLLALRARIFPRNVYVISLAIIADLVVGNRDYCAPPVLSDSDPLSS